MRIMLLCSAFNGLSQRAWIELRAAGHEVSVHIAGDGRGIRAAVEAADPEIVICPYLRERVPAEVWQHRRTVIVHPGPVGDRGPSSLDWAISDAETRWGVTALQAVEELDAGPVWGSRSFRLGPDPIRKISLYNGAVADAAIELIREVVDKATDASFVPRPLDRFGPHLLGRLRPAMRQADRTFSWSDPTDHVLRRVRAGDGAPGVRAELSGLEVVHERGADSEGAVLDDAKRLARSDHFPRLLEAKRAASLADERCKPLEAYRIEELGEMSRDIFDDRHGFSEARRRFVRKERSSPSVTEMAGLPLPISVRTSS